MGFVQHGDSCYRFDDTAAVQLTDGTSWLTDSAVSAASAPRARSLAVCLALVASDMITCRFADSPIRRHPDSSTSRFVDNPIRRQLRVSPSTNRDKKLVENAGLEKSQFVDKIRTHT